MEKLSGKCTSTRFFCSFSNPPPPATSCTQAHNAKPAFKRGRFRSTMFFVVPGRIVKEKSEHFSSIQRTQWKKRGKWLFKRSSCAVFLQERLFHHRVLEAMCWGWKLTLWLVMLWAKKNSGCSRALFLNGNSYFSRRLSAFSVGRREKNWFAYTAYAKKIQ